MADRQTPKALAEFVSETQETVEALDADLLRLEESQRGGEADPEVVNAVFRAAHTLKGLASMFGVERMAALAHALEDRLDDVRMGRQPLDASTLDLLLAAPDLFTRIVTEEAEQRPPATGEAAQALAERLRTRAAAAGAAGADPLRELELPPGSLEVLTEYEEHRLRASVEKGLPIWRICASLDLATFDTALEALKARLKEVGEVICMLPSADPGDPSTLVFDLLLASAQGPERVEAASQGAAVSPVTRRPARPAPAVPVARLAPLPPTAEPAPVPAEPPPAAEPSSLRSLTQAVRVDIRKLDRLMNLVGDLALVKSAVAGISERLRAGEEAGRIGLDLFREARLLERKLAELQTGLLEVRMVPLGQLFEKLSRMVKKLTREHGKEVELRLEGSEVELDKLIVEELSDPLMHLIRNALDHGVEPPEARRLAGKRVPAQVRLSARQKGSHVVVTVEDDGAGVDLARVRAVAVERGLLDAEAAAMLSRAEAMGLIFLPGFSTAGEVTELSGRGVGLDVVRNDIANLSGIIDLESEAGRGTRFEITLPVTLAIIKALVVGVAGRTYALPLNGVLEILELRPGDVRTIERREVITLRGSTLPLLRLDRYFGLPARPPGSGFVVVTGLAQQRLGVVVDLLHGEQDVVVKPLGRGLAGVKGISGATDLGERRTVLVVDVASLIGAAAGEPRAEAAGTA